MTTTLVRPRRRLALAVLGVLTTAMATVAVAPATASSATGTQQVTAVTATAPAPTVTTTLRSGSRGPQVTALQQRLVALRYDVGPVDGSFGSNTLHAVRAFQKVQGLPVDGVVGAATRARLAAPQVPRPRRTSAAPGVEVDLTKRVLLLNRAGEVTRIVDVSPGKPSTPTPTGTFTLHRRIDGWRQSPLGLLWRPIYFSGGYALHGSTSVPTHAASHGCVRLTVPAMNRLWPAVQLGQQVVVYR
jgi:peptidoglycan hydrolase-like protein with peptidoglycan-binding domain